MNIKCNLCLNTLENETKSWIRFGAQQYSFDTTILHLIYKNCWYEYGKENQIVGNKCTERKVGFALVDFEHKNDYRDITWVIWSICKLFVMNKSYCEMWFHIVVIIHRIYKFGMFQSKWNMHIICIATRKSAISLTL